MWESVRDASGSSTIITFSALITLPAHKFRVKIHLWGQRWEISRNEMKKFSALVDKASWSVVWLSMSMTMSYEADTMISIIGRIEMNAVLTDAGGKGSLNRASNGTSIKRPSLGNRSTKISDLCRCLYLNNHLLSLIQLNFPLRRW